jgi:hypothetical protein
MAVPLALRAAAELERRRRQAEVMSQMNGDDLRIPDEMSFREWCERLAERGMKVDGKPFRLDNRAALLPIYEAIPSTREEAAGRILIIQKATQLGLTILETLASIYMAVKWGPVTVSMFMPSQSVAIHKSEHRFMRIVRSAPDLYRLLTTGRGVDGKEEVVGEGNVLTRRVRESLVLFLWTTGKVTTESIPADIVTLDEVQEMTLDQIDKVMARTGDSDIAFVLLLSTANMPDLDINFWYQQGDQRVWNTECSICGALSDLSDPAGIFPGKSIGYNNGDVPGVPLHEYYWRCPECSGPIEDPQRGRYIATNPAAPANAWSFLLPRTISPRLTPRAMFEAWGRAKTGDQKKSFYNRTLARPYIDADQLPVTMAHCDAAVAEGARMGVRWKSSGRDTYMGIDQMGGFNAVIIKERLPDGRQAVIHVEAVFDNAPFVRCAELMDTYNVAVCVVEQLPNVNDARRFANRFPGRVFLAGYADLRDDAMTWGDDLSQSDRKTADEDRTRYTVTLNQYKCMQTSLYRIRGTLIEGRQVPMCLFPDPDALEQDVLDNGNRKRIPILRDWVFVHFTKTALVVEQDEEQRKARAKVVKIGIDPHYSFANMLCDIAWARSHGNSFMILPNTPAAAAAAAQEGPQQPGAKLPDAVVAAMEELAVEGTCGRCVSFKEGACLERGFSTGAATPACMLYIPRS